MRAVAFELCHTKPPRERRRWPGFRLPGRPATPRPGDKSRRGTTYGTNPSDSLHRFQTSQPAVNLTRRGIQTFTTAATKLG